jgi:hypothetical protein
MIAAREHKQARSCPADILVKVLSTIRRSREPKFVWHHLRLVQSDCNETKESQTHNPISKNATIIRNAAPSSQNHISSLLLNLSSSFSKYVFRIESHSISLRKMHASSSENLATVKSSVQRS